MTDDAAERAHTSDDETTDPHHASSTGTDADADTAASAGAGPDANACTDANAIPGANEDSEPSGVRDWGNALASSTRFGKFASVGVIGAVFDLTTATALQSLGVFPELAVFIGIEVAVVVMFLLNDNWTFSTEGHHTLSATLRRLLRSNLVRAGGITVQLATFRLLYRVFFVEATVLGIDGWFVAAKVTGIGTGLLVNYVAESLFTWRVHE